MGRLMPRRGISIRYPDAVGAAFGGATTPATFTTTDVGDGSGVAAAVGSAVGAGDGVLSGLGATISATVLTELVDAGPSAVLEHPASALTNRAAVRRWSARAPPPQPHEFTSAFYAKPAGLGKLAGN